MRFKRPKNLSYQETVRFHGHDGPFLAIGYRLGRHAIKVMKPRGIMDLTITVRTRVVKPYTCMIDGLQCSTFSTTGKGNMLVVNNKGDEIVVEIRKGKVMRRYAMTRRARGFCVNTEDLHKSARRIRKMPIAELWTPCK